MDELDLLGAPAGENTDSSVQSRTGASTCVSSPRTKDKTQGCCRWGPCGGDKSLSRAAAGRRLLLVQVKAGG